MDRVKYILSNNNIITQFTIPGINEYNFNIFSKIIIININDTLWIRLDDAERYLIKYLPRFMAYILAISKDHIKYLSQLCEVSFWDSSTDIYIHESEFILLTSLTGFIDWYEILNVLDNIRLKKTSTLLNNNVTRNNIKNIIKTYYNFELQLHNYYNYIITMYNNMFTIKCIENNEIFMFLLYIN